MAEIKDRRIAILATNGVEEVELTTPIKSLRDAGAEVTLVSLEAGEIQAMQHDVNPAGKHKVDIAVAQASPDRFDGLVLPGGTTNPDKLRTDRMAVAFVKGFVDAGKPIAAICHGSWTLINAGGVDGHRMTSWPSLQADLENAGAAWVDEPVVIDGKLVTSRKPDDLPRFCNAMVELFARG